MTKRNYAIGKETFMVRRTKGKDSKMINSVNSVNKIISKITYFTYFTYLYI